MKLIEATYLALQRSLVDINDATATIWDVIEIERDEQYIVVSTEESKDFPIHLPTLRVCRGMLNACAGTTLPMTTMACVLELVTKAARGETK